LRVYSRPLVVFFGSFGSSSPNCRFPQHRSFHRADLGFFGLTIPFPRPVRSCRRPCKPFSGSPSPFFSPSFRQGLFSFFCTAVRPAGRTFVMSGHLHFWLEMKGAPCPFNAVLGSFIAFGVVSLLLFSCRTRVILCDNYGPRTFCALSPL